MYGGEGGPPRQRAALRRTVTHFQPSAGEQIRFFNRRGVYHKSLDSGERKNRSWGLKIRFDTALRVPSAMRRMVPS